MMSVVTGGSRRVLMSMSVGTAVVMTTIEGTAVDMTATTETGITLVIGIIRRGRADTHYPAKKIYTKRCGAASARL